jgi:hypothetical protein
MSIPFETFFWPLPPLLSALPSNAWGLSHSPSVMPSTVAPSSPIRTPTHRKNVQTTCSVASRSSIAVAPSIGIYEVQPPSEHTSSLAVIQVHSQGIPDDLPGSLPPVSLTLGLQSQKTNALQVDTRIPGLVPRQLQSLSSSNSVSTTAGNMCTNKPTQRITYFSRPIVTLTTKYCPFPRGDTTHQLNLHTLNTCSIHWSPESAQTVHPPVAP